MQTHDPTPEDPSPFLSNVMATPHCLDCQRPMRPVMVMYSAQEKAVTYECIGCGERTTESTDPQAG